MSERKKHIVLGLSSLAGALIACLIAKLTDSAIDERDKARVREMLELDQRIRNQRQQPPEPIQDASLPGHTRRVSHSTDPTTAILPCEFDLRPCPRWTD